MQSPLPMKHHRRSTERSTFRRLLMLTIGAIIFAIGLKGFLVPNNIIDAESSGISIIGSKVTDTTLAFWLFFLNIPFIFFGYKQIGKTFALSTLYAIFIMAIATKLLEHIGPLTSVRLTRDRLWWIDSRNRCWHRHPFEWITRWNGDSCCLV